MFVCFVLLLSLLALQIAPSGARAEEPRPLNFDRRIEGPLIAVGASAWILSEILKSKLAPANCRWCEPNALDERARDAFRWHDVMPARRASDALLLGVVPIAAFSSAALLASGNHASQNMSTDMLMLVESMVLTADLTQLVKFSAARQRPYAYADRSARRDVVLRADDNLSFFSGHTSTTFSLAVAAGTTASLRGYKQAPLVWGIGLSLATLTGYFRLAGDKHYLTDVLTGALLGAAVGALVPWLHTLGTRENVPAMTMTGPGTVSFSWVR